MGEENIMNLATALSKVSSTLRKPRRIAQDQRRARGDASGKSTLTSAKVTFLRSLRADNPTMTIKEIHEDHAPEVSYWTVKSIYKSNSVW